MASLIPYTIPLLGEWRRRDTVRPMLKREGHQEGDVVALKLIKAWNRRRRR